MAQILVFWDSIAHGLFEGEEAFSWADLLKRSMQSVWHRVFNLSIPGDDTEGLLERFSKEFQSRGADMVIFAVGINDTKCHPDPHMREFDGMGFSERIQKLITLAKQRCDQVVWIGLTPIKDELTSYMQRNYFGYVYDANIIRECDRIIREHCHQFQVHYIDMNGVLSPKDLFDGLHPDGNWQRAMFERISSELRSTEL